MKRKHNDGSSEVDNGSEVKKPADELNYQLQSLKESLKEEQNEIPALREFTKLCQDEEKGCKFVTLYLKTSPECKELFGLFNVEGRPSPEKLELIWEAFESILSVMSENKEDRLLNSSGVFLVNKLLQNHLKLLYSSLSLSSKESMVKSTLKLMTYMVAQGKQSLKDVLLNFDFSHKGFRAAATKRNRKLKPDIRTCFVRFCLAFFAFGDTPIIKKMLEEKGLGDLIMKDIHLDSSEAILVVLQTLKDKVVEDGGLLKKTKLMYFNPSVLNKLTMLCKNSSEEVKNAALDLLTCLTTNTKSGICFYAKDAEFSNKLLNPMLLKFLHSIKALFLGEMVVQRLVIKILQTSIDLIVPFMASINLRMEPRPSDFWFTNIKFITELWKNIPMVSSITMSKNTSKDFTLLMKLVIPETMKKLLCMAAIKHKNIMIQEHVMYLIEVILHRCIDLKNVLSSSFTNDSDANSKLLELIHNLPEVSTVITLRQVLVNKKSKKVEGDDLGKETDPAEMSEEERDHLSLLSIKILWLYQKLKPGILTESGFNICKLLFADSIHGNKEVVDKVLDILIQEDDCDTRLWLEKKLPGTNIIHLVINTLLDFQQDEEIVMKGKQVLFKILRSVEFYDNYADEIGIWVDELLTVNDDDKKDVCDFLSDAVYKLLNDPYTLHQEMLSILRASSLSQTCEFTALSVILMRTFRKTEVSPLCYDYLKSTIKKVLVCQDDPSFLTAVLVEISQGCMEKYEDLFVFAKQLLVSLHLHHDFMDKIVFESQHNEEKRRSDVIQAVTVLTALALKNEKSEVKKVLKNFLNVLEKITDNVESSKNVVISTKYMCTIIKVLHCTDLVSKCSLVLKKALILILQSQQYLLSSGNSVQKERCAEILLSLYSRKLSVKETDTWREFSEKLVVQCVQSLQSSNKALSPSVEFLLQKLKTETLRVNTCAFLHKIIPFLPEELCIRTLESLTSCILSCDYQTTKNDTYDAFNTIIKDCSEKMMRPALYEFVMEKIDLSVMFQSALGGGNETVMALCHNLYLLYPSSVLLKSIDQNHVLLLMEHSDKPVFTEFLELLLKSNSSVCDMFLDCISKGVADSFDQIRPLLALILKIKKFEDLPDKFYNYLANEIWDDLLSSERVMDVNAMSILLETSVLHSEDKLAESVEKLISILQNLPESQMEVGVLELVLKFFDNVIAKDSRTLPTKLVFAMMELYVKFKEQTCLQKIVVKYLQRLASTELGIEDITSPAGIWKTVVVDMLKKHYTQPEYLNALRDLTEKMYSLPNNSLFEEKSGLKLKELHDMIVGHSKFLTIFIDEEKKMSACKDSLVALLRTITTNSADVCNPAFVPVLLMAYNGALSKQDQEILTLLRLYEMNNCLDQFPVSWGSQAIEAYKLKSKPNEMVREISSFHILSNLEGKKLFKTAIAFPVGLKLQENNFTLDENNEMYDPRFLLLLFSAILRPGNMVDCRHFLESGCLSVVIAGLASRDITLRKVAYAVVAQYQDFLESARFREKAQVDYLLMLLKNSIYEEYMSVPSVWAVFIIRYISLLVNPDQSLYSILNHQLLRKPIIYFKELPLFLHFFHGTSTEHNFERAWILKVLANGLKDYAGYCLYKKFQVFELVLSYYGSSICDKKSKGIVVDLLTNACSLPTAAFDLIKMNGLLSWLHFQITKSRNEQPDKLIALLYTLVKTFEKSIAEKKSNGKTKTQVPRQFSSEVIMMVLHCLEEYKLLSKGTLRQLCYIATWVLKTPDHFGDLVSRMRHEDKTKLLKSLQSFLFQSDEKVVAEHFEMFKDVLFNFAKKPDITSLLRNLDWKELRAFASNHIEINVKEMFSELMKYREGTGNEDVNTFIEIIQITS